MAQGQFGSAPSVFPERGCDAELKRQKHSVEWTAGEALAWTHPCPREAPPAGMLKEQRVRIGGTKETCPG